MIRAVKTLERLWPWLGVEIAWRLWRTPRKPRKPSPTAALVMDQAEHSTFESRGHSIATYRWGSGPQTVLLVHGWEGRAADFADLVRELRSPKRTILALDAPGHGRSSGRRTTVMEYAAILADLARPVRNIEAVISHSFGTPTVAAATRDGVTAGGVTADGVTADRFVSISGVADLTQLVPTFCRMLGLAPATAERVRARIEKKVFGNDPGVWERYSASSCPLPGDSPILIVHDRGDRVVDFRDAGILAASHGTLTTTIATEGLGHSRILAADLVLDAVSGFLNSPKQRGVERAVAEVTAESALGARAVEALK